MASYTPDSEFPYSLTISLPLPTERLASSALHAIEVDTEISPYIRRDFTLLPASGATSPTRVSETGTTKRIKTEDEEKSVLQTTYRATTNRMLRVAVNGFMESLGVVLGVMHELDVDVLDEGEEVEE